MCKSQISAEIEFYCIIYQSTVSTQPGAWSLLEAAAVYEVVSQTSGIDKLDTSVSGLFRLLTYYIYFLLCNCKFDEQLCQRD